MAVKLKSKLFTEGDAASIKKLDDCANGRPNEVLSHFEQGKAEGNHIRRIQQALKNIAAQDPDLKDIPAFSVNGRYDEDFANAIGFFKEKRGILNFAGKIDKIVGVKTIQALDEGEDKAKQPERPSVPPEFPTRPTTVPRALPNCASRSDIQPSKPFSIRMLGALIGGEGLEFSAIFWAIRDLTNPGGTPLSSLYRSTGLGLGTPSGAPFTLSGGGKPTNFTLDAAAKVCDFQTIQIGQATSPVLPLPPDPKVPQPIPLPELTQKGIAGIIVQALLPNGGTTSTGLMKIDTGPSQLEGVGGQFGFMTNLTLCQKQRGAVRREIGVADIGRF